MEIKISTDKSKLDLTVIYDYLSNHSYWAKGRSFEDVKTTIENSLCFGLFNRNEEQIGFARVVTDKAAFAYLMDVFVLESYRGKDLGRRLISSVLEHPDLQVRFFLLGTVDAQEFYKKFGFDSLTNTERYMEIRNPHRP